jgi:hypothetical protein
LENNRQSLSNVNIGKVLSASCVDVGFFELHALSIFSSVDFFDFNLDLPDSQRSSSIKDRKKRSASPTSLKDTGKKFFQKDKINKTKGESGKSKLKSKKSTEENMESACNSKKPTSTQDADSTFPIFTLVTLD